MSAKSIAIMSIAGAVTIGAVGAGTVFVIKRRARAGEETVVETAADVVAEAAEAAEADMVAELTDLAA